MKPVVLRKTSFDQIVAQAEREFPFECCGFIIGDDAVEEVRPITNIQNRMHDEDPIAFARDACTAFLMEPREHLAVMNEIDRRRLKLSAVTIRIPTTTRTSRRPTAHRPVRSILPSPTIPRPSIS